MDEHLARPVRLAQYRSAGRAMKAAGCPRQSPHGRRPPINRTVSDGPELSPGIPPHEIHVVVPPPPGTGALGVGDLVCPTMRRRFIGIPYHPQRYATSLAEDGTSPR